MKFQVFKDGKIDKDFELSAAYLFGADAIPLSASDKIKCKNGAIECKRKTNDSAGIALLWPVRDFGRILLHTTRLPERKEVYNLNMELARAELMQITLKLEDWSLFGDTNGFTSEAEEAKSLFIEGLENISDPAKASVLADRSLKKALEFSEKLAIKHAEQFVAIRCKKRTLGRHSLGCRIDPDMIENEKYRKRLLEMFGFVTIPVNWSQIEPSRGNYDFSSIDRCIDSLGGRRVAICAGPLLCFAPGFVPKWLPKGKGEFEKIRESAYEFVSQVVTRYSRYIHAWRVISGMNACNEFGFEQIIEMTRTACLAARSADVKSRRIIEISSPWGEYYAYNRQTIPPLIYADMIIQSGINFDAFALQFSFGKDEPGKHVRDMMQISILLDYFAPVNKPVHITSVAVPSRTGSPDDGNRAGFWHKPWDQTVQSQWIEQFYKIALGRPFINSITYSNLADSSGNEIPDSGLLNGDFSPKKAFMVLARLQKLILKR